MFRKRYSTEDWYNIELKRFIGLLGSGITTGSDLDRVGRSEFKGKWSGIFMSDQNLPRRGYCIVNTDRVGDPGVHWVAVGSGMVYDSFGRSNILNKPGLKDTDYDAEQTNNEANCGQRCLAWLSVLDSYGPDEAATI